MLLEKPPHYPELQKYSFLSGILLLFIAILIRNIGLYPTIFGDEYFFSKFSRLVPLADSPDAGYIYLAIYRLTRICGDGFLEGARILNSVFFVAAAPFIYMTAKRVCTNKIASIITLLALVGPINVYTVYYMAESLYFFSFWILTWFLLQLDDSSNSKAWCYFGVLWGIASLIKPHALLLCPALLIYIICVTQKNGDKWVFRAFINFGLAFFFMFFTKFLLGYLIAGRAGITLFGSRYGFITANASSASLQRVVDLLTLSMENFQGHVLGLCLMFGLPIAVAFATLKKTFLSKTEISSAQKLCFYTLAVLLNLLITSAIFAAPAATSGPYESILRLAMRYYNFSFPLLFMIAGAQLSAEPICSKLKCRAIVACPIGLAIVFVAATRFAPYKPSLVDCPELRGITVGTSTFYLLCGISLVALIAWVFRTKIGAKVYIYLLMPLMVIFSAFYVNQELRPLLVPDTFVKAGIFTKQYLSKEDLAKVVVVDSEPAGALKSLFYIDHPQSIYIQIPQEERYDLTKDLQGYKWVLVVGDHKLLENNYHKLAMEGFTLVRMPDTITINFNQSSWPEMVSSVSGLSAAEEWGAWSVNKHIIFEFAKPLPAKFTVHLTAYAFGPNAGKEIVAHVGDSEVRFTLDVLPKKRIVEFENPQRSNTIKIEVPIPTSPKMLGKSDDERTLGIAFTKLNIVPR